MAGALGIILIVVAAVAAFFLYRRWKKNKDFSKAFSNPIEIHDPGQGGKVVGSAPESSFISPITKKAITGQARAYYAGATY